MSCDICAFYLFETFFLYTHFLSPLLFFNFHYLFSSLLISLSFVILLFVCFVLSFLIYFLSFLYFFLCLIFFLSFIIPSFFLFLSLPSFLSFFLSLSLSLFLSFFLPSSLFLSILLCSHSFTLD